MANYLDNQNRVKRYKTPKKLLKLWSDILERETPDWESGKALEYFILRAFELEGATVRYPYEVNWKGIKEQIDGVVYVNGLSCLVESKDYGENALNIEPIAKLRNQLLRRPSSTIGSIFSISGFTEPALTLAMFTAPQSILLWEKEQIEYCLKNAYFCRGLEAKFRHCVEEGNPIFDFTSLNLKK